MILTGFTVFHVLLSLAGIIAGFVVLYGLLASKRLDGWTSLFLSATVATSVTGFLFPVHRFLPSHAVGTLSLIALLISILARYRYMLGGGWRQAYVISAVTSLYFNVFVLIAQLFQKVPALRSLAPTQAEPAFVVAQLGTLVLFVMLGIGAVSRFHAQPARSA
jgi:hypothetical protein